VDSRLGRRNGRRYAPLRSVTTAGLTTVRRERGIASPQTVPIGLTGKHSGEDGSDDEEKGQGEDCEPMHGGEDVTVSWWGKSGYPGKTDWGGMVGMINGRVDAHTNRRVWTIGPDTPSSRPCSCREM